MIPCTVKEIYSAANERRFRVSRKHVPAEEVLYLWQIPPDGDRPVDGPWKGLQVVHRDFRRSGDHWVVFVSYGARQIYKNDRQKAKPA